MRKYIFIALAIVTQLANAKTVMPVLVQLEEIPIRGFQPVEAGEKTLIQILPEGSVVGERCHFDNSGLVLCDESVELATLDKHTMNYIHTLVKRAQVGAIISPDSWQPVCLVLPTRSERITANNGTVFLESGNLPCGAVTMNDTRAAMELAQMMRNYKLQFEELKG